ncbi:MAG TPA: hypothetical protein VFP60_14140 [Pseudolabrys sp.]|nr:hypothetical protein [Pseudolabrys sp.]
MAAVAFLESFAAILAASVMLGLAIPSGLLSIADEIIERGTTSTF